MENHVENYYRQTIPEIDNLPHDTQQRFYKTVNHLYQSYWGRNPTPFEYAKTIRILQSFRHEYGQALPKITMSDDDTELLTQAFESSAMNNGQNLAYISGVFNQFKRRGIKTGDDYWEYEVERDRRKSI